MIKTFKNKSLTALWETDKSRIDKRMHRRVLIRLAVINEATSVEDINLPGYNFHALQGINPKRYTVHVNGPWCLTFEFEDGNAYQVNFEQYH
jgi:proteic killer suppression protein